MCSSGGRIEGRTKLSTDTVQEQGTTLGAGVALGHGAGEMIYQAIYPLQFLQTWRLACKLRVGEFRLDVVERVPTTGFRSEFVQLPQNQSKAVVIDLAVPLELLQPMAELDKGGEEEMQLGSVHVMPIQAVGEIRGQDGRFSQEEGVLVGVKCVDMVEFSPEGGEEVYFRR